MSNKQIFETTLEKHRASSATAIKFPFDVEKVFGKKRIPVCGTINKAPFRSTIFRMNGEFLMVINRNLRIAANAAAGDVVKVEIEPDAAPREVELPADLLAALNENLSAKENWEKLSYTHRKEFVEAIREAKKPETRTRRIEKTVQELLTKFNKK